MNLNGNSGSHLPTTRPTGSGTFVAVGVKHCCNILIGDQCDCEAFAAEASAALTGNKAIMCRPASQWNDPATVLGVALHRAEHPNREDGCVLCEPVGRTQAVA
jgi:hypothetical protein